MFKFVTLAFVVAVSFAAADHGMHGMGDIQTMSSDEATINEYIKEYLKLYGTVHPGGVPSNSQHGTVQPEHLRIHLYSSPEDIVKGTLGDYNSIMRYPLYNSSLETKIYIHGWLDKDDTHLSQFLSQLYALRGKRVNFITLDWSEYAFSHDFKYTAREVVPKIAEYLVPMVQSLMSAQNNNKVHLIGFGMGAHIAGLVGKRIQPVKCARITGLSPAGRFYNEMPEDRRLAKGDAEYVDVIHTNMGGAGISKTIGDVDFLPNGGRVQPEVETKSDRAEKDVISHMLARNYYFESVELGYLGFVGKKCESWTNFLNQRCAFYEAEVMGEPVSRKVNGTIYLSVNKNMRPYYSKGIYGLYPYPGHAN